jgi:pyridoxine kinase
MRQNKPPLIIVASSHVAHGAVGNRIIVPALQALGCTVIEITTIHLSWHPGMIATWGRPTRSEPSAADFTALCAGLEGAPFLPEVTAILTGYLGDASQAETLSRLVQAAKAASPELLYACDPVMGDDGKLYVPEQTAEAITKHLWPLADIVTPNAFEREWISKHVPNAQVSEFLKKRLFSLTTSWKVKDAMITDIATRFQSGISQTDEVTHPFFPDAPKGTGDMHAALILGMICLGSEPLNALTRANEIVVEAIKHAKATNSASLAPERLAGFVAATAGT